MADTAFTYVCVDYQRNRLTAWLFFFNFSPFRCSSLSLSPFATLFLFIQLCLGVYVSSCVARSRIYFGWIFGLYVYFFHSIYKIHVRKNFLAYFSTANGKRLYYIKLKTFSRIFFRFVFPISLPTFIFLSFSASWQFAWKMVCVYVYVCVHALLLLCVSLAIAICILVKRVPSHQTEHRYICITHTIYIHIIHTLVNFVFIFFLNFNNFLLFFLLPSLSVFTMLIPFFFALGWVSANVFVVVCVPFLLFSFSFIAFTWLLLLMLLLLQLVIFRRSSTFENFRKFAVIFNWMSSFFAFRAYKAYIF